jgi:hypothetical protein
MTNKFHSTQRYLHFTILIFIVEVLIALFFHDRFIRPFFGDFLVVIFIFYFVKAFTKLSDWKAAWFSLAFSYLVELLQYLHVLRFLGMSHNKTAIILMGNSFAWEDMLCYTLGILAVLCFELNFIKYYFPKSDID